MEHAVLPEDAAVFVSVEPDHEKKKNKLNQQHNLIRVMMLLSKFNQYNSNLININMSFTQTKTYLCVERNHT